MRRASHALAAYLVITLVATWPLARGLGRDVAWDLGDSLLNMWILAWDGEQLLAILRGDFSRLGTFFDANIFHPAPLSLAYSEHLIAQAVQVLPVYAITGNPILGYNLLFLSTFVLSGLGMYLLVRELTGNPLAAFVAGCCSPLRRTGSRSPRTCRCCRRSGCRSCCTGCDATLTERNAGRRRGALRDRTTSTNRRARAAALGVGGARRAGSLVGYYLLYFTPFAAAYALWEIAQRRLWRDRRVWLHLGAAGVFTSVAHRALPAALCGGEAALRHGADADRGHALVGRRVFLCDGFPGPADLGASSCARSPRRRASCSPGWCLCVLALVGLSSSG